MRNIASKMKGSEAQVIAQWLRGLAALVDDLDSVLSTAWLLTAICNSTS